MSAKEEWMLKAGGETFGPESRERLLEWARMGRIQPGQEISIDGETWYPVVEVPFLDMRWSIDPGDGKPRGPFNREAADALIRSGRLPPGARLVESRPPFPDGPFPPSAGEGRMEDDLVTVPDETAAEGPEEPVAVRLGGDEPGALAELKLLREQIAGLKAANTALAADKARLESDKARLEAENASLESDKAAVAADAARAKAEFAAETAKLKDGSAAELARVSAALDEAVAAAERAGEEWEKKFAKATEEWEKKLALADTELAAAKTAAGQAAELAAKRQADDAAALAEANARAESAARKAAEAETAYAELLESSNRRESEYQTRIARLGEELRTVPPDSAAAAAASAAIFELMQAEADDIARALEREKREAESARQEWQKREDRLLARRQELLRRLGDGPSNMLKRAVGDNPENPQTVRLRSEYDLLRQRHEVAVREAEQHLREALERAKRLETENARLQAQCADNAQAVRAAGELRKEMLKREHELVELRQRLATEERESAAARQALSRFSGEGAPRPESEILQSREAHSVKLASWMRLKR